MEPLLIFESFNFSNLDRSWIKQVWESSFSTFENVPVDYLMFLESQDVAELLKESRATVKDWMSRNGASDDSEKSGLPDVPTEVSWQTLVALNLDVRALLAVLGCLMKRGQDFDSGADAKQSCLRATSLYFVLLSIAGSNAFQAFHPSLYEIALKTLTLSRFFGPKQGKNGKSSLSSPENDSTDDDDDDDDDDEISSELSKFHSETFVKGLNGVVYDLVTMLKSNGVSLEIRSLEITIFHLVETTKLADVTFNDFSRLRNSKSEATPNSLAYNAYVALRFVCDTKYGTVSAIARMIGKYVLPQLIVTGNSQFPAKRMTILQNSTIHFLKTLLEKHGREAQEALIPLVQHLMLKPPERLDGRQKQAVIVIKLINLCHVNPSVYEKCLKCLIQLSHHNKIICKLFAQEIIGKFLLDLTNSHDDSRNDENRWPKMRTERLLVAGALSRCDDCSSMVRGRAIATFADYTDFVDNPGVVEIFRARTNGNGTEMPSLDDLSDAIDNVRTSDVLPTFRGIVEMLRKRSDDERALVRKSSIQALRNGTFVAPELLEEARPLIKNHCRDGASTVRRYAIRSLTTILEKFPNDRNLCKDWVDAVVPRVFDGETKVQEEVMDSLEKLTIGKIVAAGSVSTLNPQTTDLPWRIIRELSLNEMEDHLTKVCGIWVNSGTITNSTLTKIKSHVGTVNNVGAWLLLACISKHRTLENMTNYNDWYEKALTMNVGENGYLASVVLRVLRHCWPSFDDQSLAKIQEDLLTRLKNYGVRADLISQCLDVLHGIGTFRALEVPSGSKKVEATMRDLVDLSERTMTRSMERNDSNDDDDPAEIFLRATCTLGHASFLCSEKISFPIVRMLQGLLVEWNMVPKLFRAKRELQGAAVMVLGQQSLRDRDVAQEMTPIFGRLLRNPRTGGNMANGPAVRMNAAKALADICARFTALVEPYLPDMCISMKDSDPDVRQVILVIFIQLLSEDFIKINGPIFFHILSMVSDSDPTIRRMTIFLVKDRLLSKNKYLGTQQFVNSVFHYNGYERRIVGNSQRKMRTNERETLTLPGEKWTNERRMIYDFMLEHIDAPGKLTILVGLTRQLLNARFGRNLSSLGRLNVDTDAGVCVFKDIIHALSSEQLQPNSFSRQSTDDDGNEDNGISGTTTTTTAAHSLIVEAMKKHRLRILLPGLVELRRRFAREKSDLAIDVAKFIYRLMSCHTKDQLESLHNEYPKLEKEIERDIRKCDAGGRIVDDEVQGRVCKTSTVKKIRSDGSSLVNPDWIPRIVLRRISTMTYPGMSEPRTRSPSTGRSEIGSTMEKRGTMISNGGTFSPRKNGPNFSNEETTICKKKRI